MTLKLRSRAVYAVAALMVLVGCASYARTAYTPSNAFADAPQVDPPTGSWMLPEARAADLLYVTNYSYVSVLTYPEGRQVGVLKGFVSAVGACTDASGNIFITNFK